MSLAKDEGRRTKDEGLASSGCRKGNPLALTPPRSFALRCSSFVLRPWSFVLLVLLPAAATAQFPYRAVRAAVDFSQQKRPDNPLDLPGNPGLPPKEPTRLPDPGEPDRGFRVIRAGSVHNVGEEVHVLGGGEILIRGYRVFADAARGNRNTEVWELDGNVKVVGKDSVISGQRIIIDRKSVV